MEQVLKQAILGSKEAEAKLFQQLCERFSRLTQYILWERDVTKRVVDEAMQNVKGHFAEWARKTDCVTSGNIDKRHDESFAKWTQRILDEEIEHYFQKIVAEIKTGSRSAEARLFTILDKRFTYLIKGLFLRYKVVVDEDDAKDIKQQALITISQKYEDCTPRGNFIQWAQQILKYNFLDYLKVHTSNVNRKADLVGIETNPQQQWLQIPSIEGVELRARLLALAARMSQECKQIFDFLMSDRDPKSIYELFPNLSRGNVQIKVSRCRKKLREKLVAEGIFQ